ncbi:MAG: hypothetical protein HY050_07400 [Actinobacteria bacterium]|nr:hypothetical protein [Actinomycetota bacterium]
MPRRSLNPQFGRYFRSRAHRSLWILILVAVLAGGILTKALGASPSPLTGVRVAVSGLIALGSLTLAVRVMIAIERAHRKARRS